MRIAICQIAFTHNRVPFQYLLNGAVVNTVRHGGEAARGDPRGESQGRGQQLVEDATQGQLGALAESLLARVS